MTECPSQGDTDQVFTLLPHTVTELLLSKNAVLWGTSHKAKSGLGDLEPTSDWLPSQQLGSASSCTRVGMVLLQICHKGPAPEYIYIYILRQEYLLRTITRLTLTPMLMVNPCTCLAQVYKEVCLNQGRNSQQSKPQFRVCTAHFFGVSWKQVFSQSSRSWLVVMQRKLTPHLVSRVAAGK